MKRPKLKYTVIATSVLIVILIVTVIILQWPEKTSPSISYKDVQGIGYTPNGKSAILATDSGLYAHSKRGFVTINKVKRHYYGFNVTAHQVVTSGIELEGDTPLGLIKSTDNGETFSEVALMNEAYFQGLTVGYDTNVHYAFNPSENKLMSDVGMYRSTDNGESWVALKAKGLKGSIVSIDAHPTDKETFAVATTFGVYLSRDFGDSFTLLAKEENVSAIQLDKSDHIFFAVKEDKIKLKKHGLSTKNVAEIRVPEDLTTFIDYIEVSPKDDQNLLLATSSDDVYQTFNSGDKWQKINK